MLISTVTITEPPHNQALRRAFDPSVDHLGGREDFQKQICASSPICASWSMRAEPPFLGLTKRMESTVGDRHVLHHRIPEQYRISRSTSISSLPTTRVIRPVPSGSCSHRENLMHPVGIKLSRDRNRQAIDDQL